MNGFSRKLSGDWEKQIKQLEKMQKVNVRKIHKQIGEAMVANTHLRFQDQKSPTGKPWEGTLRGGQILTKTGSLSGSVTYSATDKQVEVGTNHKAARLHQYGGVIKAKNKKFLKFKTAKGWVQKKKVVIKARPFIGFSGEDVADIETILIEAIKEANRV